VRKGKRGGGKENGDIVGGKKRKKGEGKKG